MKEVLKILGGTVFQVLRLNKFILFSLLASSFFTVEAKTESVKFLIASEERPATLFLFPGRVSLLSLPCPVTKALVGSPKDIKAEIDKFNPQDAHILLKKWGSKPSNLILKCSDRVFLFNIIPARKAHYDYVRVLNHTETPAPFKVKTSLSNISSTGFEGLREEDFSIKKILDFSWEDK